MLRTKELLWRKKIIYFSIESRHWMKHKGIFLSFARFLQNIKQNKMLFIDKPFNWYRMRESHRQCRQLNGNYSSWPYGTQFFSDAQLETHKNALRRVLWEKVVWNIKNSEIKFNYGKTGVIKNYRIQFGCNSLLLDAHFINSQ